MNVVARGKCKVNQEKAAKTSRTPLEDLFAPKRVDHRERKTELDHGVGTLCGCVYRMRVGLRERWIGRVGSVRVVVCDDDVVGVVVLLWVWWWLWLCVWGCERERERVCVCA